MDESLLGAPKDLIIELGLQEIAMIFDEDYRYLPEDMYDKLQEKLEVIYSLGEYHSEISQIPEE